MMVLQIRKFVSKTFNKLLVDFNLIADPQPSKKAKLTTKDVVVRKVQEKEQSLATAAVAKATGAVTNLTTGVNNGDGDGEVPAKARAKSLFLDEAQVDKTPAKDVEDDDDTVENTRVYAKGIEAFLQSGRPMCAACKEQLSLFIYGEDDVEEGEEEEMEFGTKISEISEPM